jgi:methylphosphotriester-DNA--protein-cysteine methyltransferase
MTFRGLAYEEIAPGPAMSDDIEYLWMVSAKVPLPTTFVRPSPGKSSLDLIVTLEGHFCAGAEQLLFGARAHGAPYLVGPLSASAALHTQGRCNAVGVKFRPGRGQAFFGVSMHETTDKVIDLMAIESPAEVRRLGGVVADATTAEARARAMEHVLEDFRARRARKTASGTIAAAMALIERSRGTLEIAELAGTVGTGARQLERLFRHAVGVSPKLACRIERVRYAMKLVSGRRPVDWSNVIGACGFYDQAHFIREFRSITGMTPARYSAGCTPTSHSYNTPAEPSTTVG